MSILSDSSLIRPSCKSDKFIGVLALRPEDSLGTLSLGGAYPTRVGLVDGAQEAEVLRAVGELCEQGAVAIASLSDELGRFQTSVAAQFAVPVGLSSLVQLRNLQARVRTRRQVAVVSVAVLSEADVSLIEQTVPNPQQRVFCVLSEVFREAGFDSADAVAMDPWLDRLEAWCRSLPALGGVLLQGVALSDVGAGLADRLRPLPVRHHRSLLDALALASGLT